MGTMQTGRSWHRLPLPNIVAAMLLSAFIVGYVAPAAFAVPGNDGDFAVSVGASPGGAVNVGTNVTYTITITYDATSTAPDTADLAFSIPAGMTYVSNNASCTGGATVSCDDLGPFAIGGDTLAVQVVATAAQPGTHDLTATLSDLAFDPDGAAGNNTFTIQTVVNPAANLALTKSAAPTTAFAGQDVTFTLTTLNGGPSTANNVTVVDTLPAGLTFKSSTSGCTATGQTVNCPPSASLANGANVVHNIVATVAQTATGSLQNTASVSSANPSATFDPVRLEQHGDRDRGDRGCPG